MKKLLFILPVIALALMGCSENGQVGANVDRQTGTAINMSASHAHIHDGNHFFLCGHTTLASGASTTFAVLTPPDGEKEAHMLFNISGSNITEIEIYEDISTTTAGTAAAPRNNNRQSSKTSALELYKDAHASTTYATLLEEYKYGDSSKFSGGGGTVDRDNELVLKQDTLYYWKIISGAADNIISYCGEWYEIED